MPIYGIFDREPVIFQGIPLFHDLQSFSSLMVFI